MRNEQRKRDFHCNVPALQVMGPVSAYKRILSQVAKDSDGCHDYVPEERSGVVPNGGDYLKGHGGVLEEKDAVNGQSPQRR